MIKSVSRRVLELSVKHGEFNLEVARKYFRNYNYNGVSLDDNVMRRARELKEAGLLTRKGPGRFAPTSRGRKLVA